MTRGAPWQLAPCFGFSSTKEGALIGIPEASVLLLLALVTLIAAILQGAAGFGFGLLAFTSGLRLKLGD